MDELPAELAEFIRTAHLTTASAEEITAAGRALRAAKQSTTSEGYTIELRALARVVSPTPSSSLTRAAARQVAICLLHTISTAPLHTVTSQLSALVSSITRSLSVQSRSARPDLRHTLALLRPLTSLAAKVVLWPTDATASAVQAIVSWCYHGAIGVGGVEPRGPDRGASGGVARGGVGGAGFGGVMGSFGASTTPLRSGAKTKSLSRSSSVSSIGSRWTDDSSDEEGKSASTAAHKSAQVRMEALACLLALATNNSKSLHPHWGLFMSDSPYARNRQALLSLAELDPAPPVRLRALAALQAMLVGSASYLAIAEDKPTKASFTSLSTRIGEIVGELHLKLAVLLSSAIPPAGNELRLALLQAAQVLGLNGPYGRLKRSLASPLCQAIRPLLGDGDDGIPAAASATLATIMRTAFAPTASAAVGPQAFDPVAIAGDAVAVLESGRAGSVASGAWHVLAAAALHPGTWDVGTALSRLRACQAEGTLEGRLAFVGAFLRAGPAQPRFATASAADLAAVGDAIKAGATSPHAALRSLAGDVLSAPGVAMLSGASHGFSAVAEACRLADGAEEDAGVRAGASRALGLLVKLAGFDGEDTDQLGRVLGLLLERCGDPEPVRAAASWAVANCCDVLAERHLPSLAGDRLVEVALGQAQDGDKLRVNAVRMLGAVLRVGLLSEQDERAARAVSALCDALRRGPAKVRWNAAAATASALTCRRWVATTSPLALQLIEAASTALIGTANFKVRIQCIAALRVPAAAGCFGGTEGLEKVRAAVEGAREVVRREGEEGVARKEEGHWRELEERLEELDGWLGVLAGR